MLSRGAEVVGVDLNLMEAWEGEEAGLSPLVGVVVVVDRLMMAVVGLVVHWLEVRVEGQVLHLRVKVVEEVLIHEMEEVVELVPRDPCLVVEGARVRDLEEAVVRLVAFDQKMEVVL